MKRIHTETGSIYEVDEVQKQVRRLTGVGSPTQRTGTDGDWRKYIEAHIGDRLLIHWHGDIKPSARPGTEPATITSRIVEIEEVLL